MFSKMLNIRLKSFKFYITSYLYRCKHGSLLRQKNVSYKRSNTNNDAKAKFRISRNDELCQNNSNSVQHRILLMEQIHLFYKVVTRGITKKNTVRIFSDANAQITHTNTHKHKHKQKHTHTNTNTYKQTNTHTNTNTHKQTNTHTQTHRLPRWPPWRSV